MFEKAIEQFVSQKLFVEAIPPGLWIKFVLNYKEWQTVLKIPD